MSAIPWAVLNLIPKRATVVSYYNDCVCVLTAQRCQGLWLFVFTLISPQPHGTIDISVYASETQKSHIGLFTEVISVRKCWTEQDMFDSVRKLLRWLWIERSWGPAAGVESLTTIAMKMMYNHSVALKAFSMRILIIQTPLNKMVARWQFDFWDSLIWLAVPRCPVPDSNWSSQFSQEVALLPFSWSFSRNSAQRGPKRLNVSVWVSAS